MNIYLALLLIFAFLAIVFYDIEGICYLLLDAKEEEDFYE